MSQAVKIRYSIPHSSARSLFRERLIWTSFLLLACFSRSCCCCCCCRYLTVFNHSTAEESNAICLNKDNLKQTASTVASLVERAVCQCILSDERKSKTKETSNKKHDRHTVSIIMSFSYSPQAASANNLVWMEAPAAFRWLQDTVNTTTNDDNSTSGSSNNSSSSSSSNTTSLSDGQVLRDTFALYGSILIVVVILFCYVRIRFPRPYTIRRWQKDLNTPLADESYGFLSWIWNLQTLISEDEILDQCGLDSLCFLRALQMGYRLCCVGALNAIWLMPVYATAKDHSETTSITDPVQQVS